KLAQLLPERLQVDRATRSCAIIQEPYAGDFPGLLRIGGGASKEHGTKRKDSDFSLHVFPCSLHSTLLTRPSLHLITVSARAIPLGGIVRPIWLAVFRLIMNSNLVGCSTGKSAGLAPLRILST